MKTAIKTEFLCVKPRSDYAQEVFENSMYKFSKVSVTPSRKKTTNCFLNKNHPSNSKKITKIGSKTMNLPHMQNFKKNPKNL